jgi:FSR family fosmidomycin resistance protein-like MFS transporter
MISLLVEPPLGILADHGKRRQIVVYGGIAFALGAAALAGASSFLVFLGALALLDPASGTFVGLSQATLVDSAPAGREANMARWTLAGGIGITAGPILLAAGTPWRWVFGLCSLLAVCAVLALSRHGLEQTASDHAPGGVLAALRRVEVVRWLVLLELQDLGGDTLFGFLALYLVDVTKTSPRVAAFAVLAWTGGGLLGNLVLLRILARIDGLRWLRLTAAAVALLFPAFQLLPGLLAKLVALTALGALIAGWYPISQARLYEALPGRSGTASAAATAASILGIPLPLVLGLLASQVGIGNAFWLCLAAPFALLLGVPRR